MKAGPWPHRGLLLRALVGDRGSAGATDPARQTGAGLVTRRPAGGRTTAAPDRSFLFFRFVAQRDEAVSFVRVRLSNEPQDGTGSIVARFGGGEIVVELF